jgi:hypothetical protein
MHSPGEQDPEKNPHTEPRELTESDRWVIGMLAAKYGEGAKITDPTGKHSGGFEELLSHCKEVGDTDPLGVVQFIASALEHGATIELPEASE